MFHVEAIIKTYNPEEICSGDSPLKGIDYLVKTLTPKERYINYPPISNLGKPTWNDGYKKRNLQIAESRIVFVIVADQYPTEYTGTRFKHCYHCLKYDGLTDHREHIKSGACWTAYQAISKGNTAQWIIIDNY